MSRKFGFGKASSGDDEAADAKGEKNEAPRDADATQAVTPPLPANPLQSAADGAPVDPTKGAAAATDAADDDASGMLAYQNLERHRKEKKRRRNVKIAVGACAAVVIAAAIIVPRVLTPADRDRKSVV